MATTSIQVTALDNEIYLIAIPSSPTFSSELCHLKGNTPPNLTIVPQAVLPGGSYTLVIIGINWGGPQAFQVVVTTDGVSTPFTAPAGTGVGVTWTQNVAITV